MASIRDEQTKLLANAIDRASTACFTIGIATPIAGFLYNVSGFFRSTIGAAELGSGLIGWLVAALLLHGAARLTLKGLRHVQ